MQNKSPLVSELYAVRDAILDALGDVLRALPQPAHAVDRAEPLVAVGRADRGLADDGVDPCPARAHLRQDGVAQRVERGVGRGLVGGRDGRRQAEEDVAPGRQLRQREVQQAEGGQQAVRRVGRLGLEVQRKVAAREAAEERSASGQDIKR